MICTNCGKEVPDDVNVCGHCGHLLKGGVTIATVSGTDLTLESDAATAPDASVPVVPGPAVEPTPDPPLAAARQRPGWEVVLAGAGVLSVVASPFMPWLLGSDAFSLAWEGFNDYTKFIEDRNALLSIGFGLFVIGIITAVLLARGSGVVAQRVLGVAAVVIGITFLVQVYNLAGGSDFATVSDVGPQVAIFGGLLIAGAPRR